MILSDRPELLVYNPQRHRKVPRVPAAAGHRRLTIKDQHHLRLPFAEPQVTSPNLMSSYLYAYNSYRPHAWALYSYLPTLLQYLQCILWSLENVIINMGEC